MDLKKHGVAFGFYEHLRGCQVHKHACLLSHDLPSSEWKGDIL